MAISHLEPALKAVNWNKSVETFLTYDTVVADIDAACNRIAIWSRQLETIDKGNPALAFVRAIQSSSQHVVATCSLALYRTAASSIRSILENGLYYTYFRDHASELSTLVRDSDYYVSRIELLAYHKLHTPDFKTLQEKFGFVGSLDNWYSEVSAVVHGQIPGIWVEHKSLDAISHDKETLKIVVKKFQEGEQLLHQLFLITVGRQLWSSFTPSAKKALLTGLSGDIKTALGMDKA